MNDSPSSRRKRIGKVLIFFSVLLFIMIFSSSKFMSWPVIVIIGFIGSLLLLMGIGRQMPDRAEKEIETIKPKLFQTLDNNTYATNPGSITLSLDRLALFHPYLATGDAKQYPDDAQFFSGMPRDKALTYLQEHLQGGDCRGALVVGVKEQMLLVAAYNDDFDACVFLVITGDEANSLVKRHALSKGSRLIAVNTFHQMKPDGKIQGDIVVGGMSTACPWSGVWPLVADFLCDDIELINQRKTSIGEDEWKRIEGLASMDYPGGIKIRSMLPFLSGREGNPISTS
jgi:hypothetical protein